MRAARRLGVDALSVNALARRVGAPRSAFYQRWPNLDAARDALAEHVLLDLVSPGPRSCGGEVVGWIEALQALCADLSRVLESCPGLAAALLGMPTAPGPLVTAVEHLAGVLVEAGGFDRAHADAIVGSAVRATITAASGSGVGQLPRAASRPGLPTVVLEALDATGRGGGGQPARRHGEQEPVAWRWHRHAGALARQLTEAGYLTSGRWVRVVASVPRHLLVALSTAPDALDERELIALYTDVSLHSNRHPRWWTPPYPGGDLTHTAPSVLAAALELASGTDPAPPADPAGSAAGSAVRGSAGAGRVLIVSGRASSAYGPALACAGCGDSHVVVADPDPDHAEWLRRTLTSVGYEPTIVTAPPGTDTARRDTARRDVAVPDVGVPDTVVQRAAVHGPYEAVLMVDTGDGPPPPAEQFRYIGQVAEGGRMIIGPDPDRAGPRTLSVLDRTPPGIRTRRHIIDPASATEAAAGCLAAYPAVLTELRTTHVPDRAGRCRACAAGGHDDTTRCEIPDVVALATRRRTPLALLPAITGAACPTAPHPPHAPAEIPADVPDGVA